MNRNLENLLKNNKKVLYALKIICRNISILKGKILGRNICKKQYKSIPNDSVWIVVVIKN